jgi:hypothetical protein
MDGPQVLATTVPQVLWCVSYAFTAWVAWDVGKRWVAAWDRSRIANERMDALEAKTQAEMTRLLNGLGQGLVDDLQSLADRVRVLEPESDQPLPKFRPLNRRMPRPPT